MRVDMKDWTRLAEETQRETPGPVASRPDPPKRRLAYPVTCALSVIVFAMYWWGPFSLWPKGPSNTELNGGARLALEIAGQALRDYARAHGRYPQELEEVLPYVVPIEYRLTAEGFELRATDPSGEPIVLRSH